MGLDEYKKRRDFSKTPEPAGKPKEKKGKGDGLVYVIQEHQAKNRHWDLRLETDGVLRSWAIPKEPPAKPGVRRLAIQTEDHPMDYAGFKGDIPQGEYGAGKVKIWDKGTYELESEHSNKMVVILHGRKLRGGYVLLRFRPGKEKSMWLFFKRK